jgi:hypothetical protein
MPTSPTPLVRIGARIERWGVDTHRLGWRAPAAEERRLKAAEADVDHSANGDERAEPAQGDSSG